MLKTQETKNKVQDCSEYDKFLTEQNAKIRQLILGDGTVDSGLISKINIFGAGGERVYSEGNSVSISTDSASESGGFAAVVTELASERDDIDMVEEQFTLEQV